MQKNLDFKWEEQVRLLQKDAVFAKNFAKFILVDELCERVEVESVSVQLQKGECEETDKIELLATIVLRGIKRTMEISLYKKGCLANDKSFKCCYYCVDAPAILLDSGKTSMHLELREDLLERWKNFNV